MSSEKIDRFSMKVTEKKRVYLGFNTGIGNRTFTGVNLRELRAETGWIISNNEIQPWEEGELREIEGSVVLLGPWKKGRCFDPEKDSSAAVLKRIAAILPLLAEKGASLEVLSPAALYLCDDGSLIVFPPRVVNFILNQMTEGDKLFWRERYGHPLFRGAKNLSWGISVHVYRALTGEYPFNGKDKAEIHDRIREGEFLPSREAAPGLKRDMGLRIDSVLSENEPDQIPEPEDWETFFEKWEKEGAFDPVSDYEKEQLNRRREKGKKQVDRRFGLKRNLSTKGVMYVIAGFIVLGVLVIAGSVAASILKPPLTRGMSPDEVIHAFYQGINTLDYPLVMDCLGPEAEDEDAATVKQEYIMAIQRTKNFGDNGIIRAEDWMAAGQPPIPPFKILLGLTDFVYDKTDDGRVRVNYTRWYTDLSDGMESTEASINQTVVLTGLKVTDLITMEQKGKDWEISRIDRTTEPFYAREVLWSEGGSMFAGGSEPTE